MSPPLEHSLKLPPPKTIHLEDGTQVVIRPIHPEDAPLLIEGFERLSPESIRLRFLSDKKSLTAEEARQFANVNYNSTMAFVATLEESERDIIIGVARYAAKEPINPQEAEAAIIVSDPYQGRGLGKHLMEHLVIYARERGIRHFCATVLFGNERILNFIQKGGLPFAKKLSQGAWEIKVDLGNKG